MAALREFYACDITLKTPWSAGRPRTRAARSVRCQQPTPDGLELRARSNENARHWWMGWNIRNGIRIGLHVGIGVTLLSHRQSGEARASNKRPDLFAQAGPTKDSTVHRLRTVGNVRDHRGGRHRCAHRPASAKMTNQGKFGRWRALDIEGDHIADQLFSIGTNTNRHRGVGAIRTRHHLGRRYGDRGGRSQQPFGPPQRFCTWPVGLKSTTPYQI